MKKNGIKIILLVLVGFFTQQLMAQNLYFKVNAGYNLSVGKSFEPFTNSRSIRNADESITSSNSVVKAGSLGKGLDFGVTAGYKFNEKISFELGVSYLLGGKINTEDYSESTYSYGNDDYFNIYGSETEFKANMLKINPSVCFNLGSDIIDPYLRVGVLIGVGKVFFSNENFSSRREDFQEGGAVNSTSIREHEFYGSIAFGYNAGIGAIFKLNDNLSLYGELNFTSMSYSPTKGKVTRYEQDGEDQLSELPTSQKEIEFKDEISYNSSYDEDVDEDKAGESLKVSFPFSTVGLQVGVIYAF